MTLLENVAPEKEDGDHCRRLLADRVEEVLSE